MAASQIGRKAVELDIVSGRSSISVAATAIYMASHASDKKLTKKKLGVVGPPTQPPSHLRDAIRELREYASDAVANQRTRDV
uniref:Transcription factor TFIIB cyclin-like domain-containing protein n=1 Tax=Daphnia galeata TaxID=27404 RepID=A0A8J2WUX8_9CRUS|nr:unnamed protein product [Daphnia galeata]